MDLSLLMKNNPGTTKYDRELGIIKQFTLHQELLPFIGKHYDEYKILLVGESHYLPEDTGVKAEDFELWYSHQAPKAFKEREKDYYTTRNVIDRFISHNRSRSYSLFADHRRL